MACGTCLHQTMCLIFHLFPLYCGVFLRGYVPCEINTQTVSLFVDSVQPQNTYLHALEWESMQCNALLCGVCRFGFSEAVWRVSLASTINMLNSSFSFRKMGRFALLCCFRIYMVCGTGLHNMMNTFLLSLPCDRNT